MFGVVTDHGKLQSSSEVFKWYVVLYNESGTEIRPFLPFLPSHLTQIKHR